MRKIKLCSKKYGDQFALVDDDDFKSLNKVTWSLKISRGKKYVSRKVYNGSSSNYYYVSMHRLLMQFPEGEIDHRNGNGLDNRKKNLRICHHKSNTKNQLLIACNKTGYKGVHFYKKYGNYVAKIGFNYKHIHLGYFETALQAAKAYNKAAKKYHGEFARLNSISQ